MLQHKHTITATTHTRITQARMDPSIFHHNMQRFIKLPTHLNNRTTPHNAAQRNQGRPNMRAALLYISYSKTGRVLTKVLKYTLHFLRRFFFSLEIHINLSKLMLYFSYYLITSKFEASDEIMTSVCTTPIS